MSRTAYPGSLTPRRVAPLPSPDAGGPRLKSQAPVPSATTERQPQAQAQESAQAIPARWPEGPKSGGEKILQHHGEPQEVTATQMFWFRANLWSRIELAAHGVVHNFPGAPSDFPTHYVDYPVPATSAGVLLDGTAGLGVRCGREAYDILTLNLAVEIIVGPMAVDDARRLVRRISDRLPARRRGAIRGTVAVHTRRGSRRDEWITVPTATWRRVEEGMDVADHNIPPLELSIQ